MPKVTPKPRVDSDAPKERWWEPLWRWARSTPEAILVYGAGVVLALTVITLMRMPSKGLPRQEALGFIRALHDNWRAFVILSAPLLYGLSRNS